MSKRCVALILLMPLFSGGVATPSCQADMTESPDGSCAYPSGATGRSLLQVVAAGRVDVDDDTVKASKLADISSKTTQGWCRSGIESTGICCASDCDFCGTSNKWNKYTKCKKKKNSDASFQAKCCKGVIKDSGKTCSTVDDVACIIPDMPPPPTVTSDAGDPETQSAEAGPVTVSGEAACLLPDLLETFDEGCDPDDTSGDCVTPSVPPPLATPGGPSNSQPPRDPACDSSSLATVVVPTRAAHAAHAHVAVPQPSLLAIRGENPCPSVPQRCYDPKKTGKDGFDGFKQTACYAALVRRCQTAGNNYQKTACILAGMCSYGRAGTIKGSCRICNLWLNDCINVPAVRSYMESSGSIYEDLSDALPSSWGQLQETQSDACVNPMSPPPPPDNRTLKCPCGLLTCPDAVNKDECDSPMSKGRCQWVGDECVSKASLASTSTDGSLLRKSNEC